MPLEPYPRGAVWWARGRVEYNGAPITEYYRCSTGASEEQGAWDWCRKEEQTAIACVLSNMDTELSALEARRDKTRNIKQAMMQELLTGKTRLV